MRISEKNVKIPMLVWQGMPNGGDYDMLFVTELTNASDWIARNVTDDRYAWFVRDDEALYCHPCIAAWVPFNETWN